MFALLVVALAVCVLCPYRDRGCMYVFAREICGRAGREEAMSAPTPFVESNALLAVIREDYAEARGVLREMLPGELASLRRSCNDLIDCIRDEIRQREPA